VCARVLTALWHPGVCAMPLYLLSLCQYHDVPCPQQKTCICWRAVLAVYLCNACLLLWSLELPCLPLIYVVEKGIFACRDELLEVAMELEHVATSDEYFVKRGLYPNVDFYSGIVLRAMGIPISM